MKSVEEKIVTNNKGEKGNVKDKMSFSISWFEYFSIFSILALFFLLPIFSISFGVLSLVYTKTLLIIFLTLFSLILFTSYFLKNGTLRLGKYKLLIIGSSSLIPFIYFLSSFFSSSPGASFFGRMFEVDTFGFIVLCFALLSMTAILFKDRKRIFLAFLIFIFSAVVFLVLQFLGTVLNFLPFTTGIDFSKFNFLGNWNETAIFLGSVSILSLISIENIEPGWFLRTVLYFVLIFSFLFLAIINFLIVWIFMGIFFFGVLVYSISKNNIDWKRDIFSEDSKEEISKTKKFFFFIPLIFFIIACGFIFKGEFLSKKISNITEISLMEARPSLDATIEVGRSVFNRNLFFGSGPNTFNLRWAEFKPEGINNSVFWNEDFSQGFGFLPTSIISTGFFGILAWFIFFITFLYTGFKILVLYKAKEQFPYYIMLTTFLISLYFWLSTIFYTVGPVSVALAFIFTGLYAASISQNKKEFAFDFSISDKPRLGFVMVFLFGIIFIISIGGVFIATEKVSANVSFNKALSLMQNPKKIDKANEYIMQAISTDSQDIYLRTASDLKIIEIKKLLSDSENSGLKKEDYEKFRNLLASAIEMGRSAIEKNENYYRNWIKLGDVYSSVVSLNVTGSYEKAKENYEKAAKLNPLSPLINLKLARLEAARENFEEAKKYINKALNLKNNYTDAIFLLSQIQIKENDIDSAIKSVESAVLMNPKEPALFFQLGILNYNKENYEEASKALEKALILNINYLNAKYFLGLSYYKMQEREKAIKEFEELFSASPQNKEIKIILENIKAGRDPFVEVFDEKPEDRGELPLDN